MSGPATKPIRPQQPQPQPQPPRSHSIQTPPVATTKSPHGQAKAGMNDGKIPQRQQPQIQPRAYQQPGAPPNMPRPNVSMHPGNPNPVDGIGVSKQGNNHVTQPNLYPPEYQAHLEQLGKPFLKKALMYGADLSQNKNMMPKRTYLKKIPQATPRVPRDLPHQANIRATFNQTCNRARLYR